MSRDAATSVRFSPADGELTVCVSHIEGLGRLAHGEELAALSVASELVASGICTDEGIPHEDVQGVAVVVGFPSTTFTIERHSDDARVSLRGWASPFGFVLAEENETPTGVMNSSLLHEFPMDIARVLNVRPSDLLPDFPATVGRSAIAGHFAGGDSLSWVADQRVVAGATALLTIRSTVGPPLTVIDLALGGFLSCGIEGGNYRLGSDGSIRIWTALCSILAASVSMAGPPEN